MSNLQVCDDCGKEIDPDVCWCGESMEDHSGNDNHVPVAAGCTCPRDIPDWWAVPVLCEHCGKTFFRKVGGQRYCEKHRFLGGKPIRLMAESTTDVGGDHAD